MKSLRVTIRAGVFAVVCFSTTGCSKDPFNFSQADMRAAVAGTWTGPISSMGVPGYMDAGYTDEIATLVLDDAISYVGQADAGSSSTTQSMFPRQLQCGGSRTFLGGCSGSGDGETTMDIAGRVSSTEGTIPTSTVAGTFRVDGSDLTGEGTSGELLLTMPAGGGITAFYNTGEFTQWGYTPPGGGVGYALNLTRH